MATADLADVLLVTRAIWLNAPKTRKRKGEEAERVKAWEERHWELKQEHQDFTGTPEQWQRLVELARPFADEVAARIEEERAYAFVDADPEVIAAGDVAPDDEGYDASAYDAAVERAKARYREQGVEVKQ